MERTNLVIFREPRLIPSLKTPPEYEGMPRIKEVLETHDWSTPSDMNDLDDADFDFDDENDLEEELLGFGRRGPTSGFGQEVQELEREMMGLRMAIERGGGDGISDDEEPAFDHDNADEEERKVESIEALMMRMQAIRGELLSLSLCPLTRPGCSCWV